MDSAVGHEFCVACCAYVLFVFDCIGLLPTALLIDGAVKMLQAFALCRAGGLFKAELFYNGPEIELSSHWRDLEISSDPDDISETGHARI